MYNVVLEIWLEGLPECVISMKILWMDIEFKMLITKT
jgi:hypothetical protein